MDSLGELFIQLAFEGDTKGAEDFKKALNETAKAMQQAAENALQNTKAQLENNEALQEGNKAAQENNKTLQENNKQKKEQQNNIMSVSKAIAGYIAAIIGAFYAVKRLTDSLIEQNKTWLNLTRTSDIALSTYQKWNNVGKMYGVDQAASQIKNLNDRLFELKLTGANAQGFMLAGINPTNADDVMEQLRARVSGLSDTSASYLLRQMGLDENMLHILRLSSEEFQALNNEVNRFQLTPEQRKSIQEMNVELQIAGQKLQYLKDRAILAIMPHWVRFMENMAFLAQQIKKVVAWFSKLEVKYKALIIGISMGLMKLKPIAKLFSSFSKTFEQVITRIPIFGHLLAGLGNIFSRAFLPLTALYLLFDDISGYFEGKNSAIGYIINVMKDFQKLEMPKFIDKLEKTLNFKTPEWIKELVFIIKNLQKVKELNKENTPASKEEKNNIITATIVGETIKHPKITGMISSTPIGRLAAGISALLLAEQTMGNRMQQPEFWSGNLQNNNYTNTNSPKIEFNQDVQIQTNQPAQETYNSFANGLNYVNRNFIPIGI